MDRTHGAGAAIRGARKAKGMTQEQLAACCKLERTSITNIESGRQALRVETLATIAEKLEVSPGELLGHKATDASACCGDFYSCRTPCVPRADHWQKVAHSYTDRIHELQGFIAREALARSRAEEVSRAEAEGRKL